MKFFYGWREARRDDEYCTNHSDGNHDADVVLLEDEEQRNTASYCYEHLLKIKDEEMDFTARNPTDPTATDGYLEDIIQVLREAFPGPNLEMSPAEIGWLLKGELS